MAGLVPAIHVFRKSIAKIVDARDERGHDGNYHAASAVSTSFTQYEVPNGITSSLKL